MKEKMKEKMKEMNEKIRYRCKICNLEDNFQGMREHSCLEKNEWLDIVENIKE